MTTTIETKHDHMHITMLRGLETIVSLLQGTGTNFFINSDRADVPLITAAGPERPSEIIYDPSSKTFDVWTRGGKGKTKLAKPGVSASEAAQVVIDEYKAWKLKTTGRLPVPAPMAHQ